MIAAYVVVKVLLGLVYLFAGLALFWGRKKLLEEGRPPNLWLPGALLIIAGLTTMFL
jgi:hypothetical protein